MKWISFGFISEIYPSNKTRLAWVETITYNSLSTFLSNFRNEMLFMCNVHFEAIHWNDNGTTARLISPETRQIHSKRTAAGRVSNHITITSWQEAAEISRNEPRCSGFTFTCVFNDTYASIDRWLLLCRGRVWHYVYAVIIISPPGSRSTLVKRASWHLINIRLLFINARRLKHFQPHTMPILVLCKL